MSEALPCDPIDPRELAERWRRARGAALGTAGDEYLALAAVADGELDRALREVGLNSFRLGRSAAAHHPAADEPAALAALLGASGLPCLAAEPVVEGDLLHFRRAGCGLADRLGARVCDYHREAIDGLVCGLSNRLRFARLASRGRGESACEDLLYDASRPAARFAPVPAEVGEHLAAPLRRLAEQGFSIRLLGIAERRLFVAADAGRGTACGPARLYLDLLASHLARRFPDLDLVDATPRAVVA